MGTFGPTEIVPSGFTTMSDRVVASGGGFARRAQVSAPAPPVAVSGAFDPAIEITLNDVMTSGT